MAQTTFLKLLRGRHAYRNGEPIKPWLFAIAARLRIDELRRRRTREHNMATIAQWSETASPPSFERQHDLTLGVTRALSKLPDGQQRVVVLHRFTGLTFKEIGARLGLSEAAVKLRASRAYTTLRRDLAPLKEQICG